MKNLRLLLIYFCLLTSMSVTSQSIFPSASDKQKWEVITWSYWGFLPSCGRSIYETGEEINACGQVYTEILLYYQFDQDEGSVIGYYRVENDSVFVKPSTFNGGEIDCNQPDFLIYDFSINNNDTINCLLRPYENQLTKFWQFSEYTSEIFGVSRTIHKMKYYPYPENELSVFDMKWIEGIGSIVNPFYSFSCIGGHCESEEAVTKVWRNNEIIYFDKDLDLFCEQIDTNIEFVQGDIDFKILPNPIKEEIQIQDNTYSIKKLTLYIYDVSGKLVFHNSDILTNQPFSISNLSSGMYYVKIIYNGEVFKKKIIKVE